MWNGDDSYGFNGQTWKNQAANISKLVGTTIKGMDSLTSLNAEQLQKIKETYSGLWGSLDEEFRNALQQIIDYGDEYSDIIDTAKEQLTQVSFDSMYDSFVETLMDMDATSQDFADDFSEYMMKAFLAQEIGTKYQERLQSWYDSWAENMEDGELSDAELETMRSQYENIVNEALAERDRIAAITGYDSTSSSQEASSKGFTAMSEDTGSELNGRFTALQVAGESIAQNMILSMQGVNSLVDIARSGNELLNSILVQSALSNGFLEDISKFTKPLLQFSEKMDKLIDNTKSL
jgi:hypothetical protein